MAMKLLISRGFYDKDRNPGGKGCPKKGISPEINDDKIVWWSLQNAIGMRYRFIFMVRLIIYIKIVIINKAIILV